ncbi:MAG: Gfo/Idh/MocA family oxidoreductase [Planctomycetes bacterium]|nr:Gfo/Idh/MocA family oxidoreductase [Planctomycetota bacterium]
MKKTTENPTYSLDRRSFLKKAAFASSISILPSYIALGKRSKDSKLPPSERVNLAVIGVGNRGGKVLDHMDQTGLCNFVAFCDVDYEGKHCESYIGNKQDVKRYRDFRVMFDEMAKDIDAVQVSTPDHSHFCASMLAMSLGKHVYTEKPLAHTFGQCERMIDLAKRSGVATQMGNQGHSGGNYFQFKKWTEEGIIKDVTKITAFMNSRRRWHGWGQNVKEYPKETMPKDIAWDIWCDQAPVHPFSSKLHPEEWRSWFDYGSGAFGDWGPHILDTCHEFLKLGMPEKITAVHRAGPNPLVFPQESTIKFGFPAREGMPACDVTWYDGKKNIPKFDEELGYTAKKPGKVIYSKDLVFAGGSHSSALTVLPKAKFMEIRKELPRITEKRSNHSANFLLACKGEEKTRSPFSVGGSLTQVFNLGVLAQRFGGEITFDRKTQKITSDKKLNAFLDPRPRAQWEQFYKL